jgi:hypothetical protein
MGKIAKGEGKWKGSDRPAISFELLSPIFSILSNLQKRSRIIDEV